MAGKLLQSARICANITKMKDSSRATGNESSDNGTGLSEHASQQTHRGHPVFEIIAILAIGVATTLALVLLKLITQGP